MSKKVKRLLVALVLFLIVVACNEHGLTPFNEAIEGEKQDITTQFVTNQIDILWIVDNSGSMAEEQEALTYNFAQFIQGIGAINTDFHMAVVTTDMRDDNGIMRTAPAGLGPGGVPLSCPGVTGPVLRTEDYLTETSFDVDRLVRDFACIATVGTGGFGMEAGLEAMRESFSDAYTQEGGPNAGFRRENAWLAIIFVTDENDCSGGLGQNFTSGDECEWYRDLLISVQSYIDFLTTLSGTAEGQQILVAGIIGPDDGNRYEVNQTPRPSCSVPEVGTDCYSCETGVGEFACVDSELVCACDESVEPSGFCQWGEAYAGYRYEELINYFGDRGVTANICQDSFRTALENIQRVIRANLAVKCLRALPGTCETDADCAPASCTNFGPTGALRLCSDFEIVVERRDGDGPWTQVLGPYDVGPDEEPHYIIDWEAATCPTGIGIEFTPGHEPGLGTEFRIRYPIVLDDD